MKRERYVVGQSNLTGAGETPPYRWLARMTPSGIPEWTNQVHKAKRFLSHKNAESAMHMVSSRGVGRITDMFVAPESTLRQYIGIGYDENPRKNVERVYAAWQRGVKLDHGRGASVSTNGQTIYSYRTWLVYRDVYGKVMFNTTKYSKTTTMQQNSLRQMLDQDGVEYKKVKDVPQGSYTPATSFGAAYENPKRARKRRVTVLRKNPPLVTFGNPPRSARLLSRNVVDIRYQHEEDGKFYHHSFKKNQVQIIVEPGSKVAFLRRVDGKPLVEEY